MIEGEGSPRPPPLRSRCDVYFLPHTTGEPKACQMQKKTRMGRRGAARLRRKIFSQSHTCYRYLGCFRGPEFRCDSEKTEYNMQGPQATWERERRAGASRSAPSPTSREAEASTQLCGRGRWRVEERGDRRRIRRRGALPRGAGGPLSSGRASGEGWSARGWRDPSDQWEARDPRACGDEAGRVVFG